MSKIQNKKTSLMENYKNNKGKINKLTQLGYNLKIDIIKLDEFINRLIWQNKR